MNAKSIARLVAAIGGMTSALAFAGADPKTGGTDVLPPSNAVISIQVTNPPADPAPHADRLDPAAARWNEIKDLGYDRRVRFFAGLKRLMATVDGEVGEVLTRRASPSRLGKTKASDFAIKEMIDAQSYLRFTCLESTEASPETWDRLKEKIGRAWDRSRDVYRKASAIIALN